MVKNILELHIRFLHLQYPDVSPPSCSVTNQTGTCASVYGRPECVSSMWYAHVMFIDAGEGIFSITTRDNGNGTLNGRTWSLLVFK